MSGTGILPDYWDTPSHDPREEFRGLVQQAGSTLAIARGLVESGRTVDLAGLDHTMGVLCAKALDLQPAHGQEARPALAGLLDQLDALSRAMRAATP